MCPLLMVTKCNVYSFISSSHALHDRHWVPLNGDSVNSFNYCLRKLDNDHFLVQGIMIIALLVVGGVSGVLLGHLL